MQNRKEINASFLDALRDYLIYETNEWHREVNGIPFFSGTKVTLTTGVNAKKNIRLPDGVAELINYLQKNQLANRAFGYWTEDADVHIEALCKIACKHIKAEKPHFRGDAADQLYRFLADFTNLSKLPANSPANNIHMNFAKISMDSVKTLREKMTALSTAHPKPTKK